MTKSPLLYLVFTIVVFCCYISFFHRNQRKIVQNENILNCSVEGLQSRYKIHTLLNGCNARTGVELGVHRGLYTEYLLTFWESCQKLYAVDPWKPQKNYKEAINSELVEKDLYKETKNRLQNWSDKVTLVQMTSNEAVSTFKPGSLDFVYIDARHDYCATKEDIKNYWPIVKPGGILGGHDYKWMDTPKDANTDWTICEDGSRQVGSVKRAVDEFAEQYGLTITLTTTDIMAGGYGQSWFVQKDQH